VSCEWSIRTPLIAGCSVGNLAWTLMEYAGIPGTSPGARTMPDAPAGTRCGGRRTGTRKASTVRPIEYAAKAVRSSDNRACGESNCSTWERVRKRVSTWFSLSNRGKCGPAWFAARAGPRGYSFGWSASEHLLQIRLREHIRKLSLQQIRLRLIACR